MEFENGYTECLGRRQLREKMNSYKSSRENWKRFKNCPYFCQTRVFRNLSESPSSLQFKPPKHSKREFWKNFLSIFRDWKVYPQGSRELSRKNLWVTLATGLSTREQAAKYDPRTRDWGTWLDLPATELPKQGKNEFLKFSNFENKILSKNTSKTQKSFCVWINKDWTCENTFHQVQLHKWIWHLLNINLCVVCGYQQWDSP